LGIGYADPGPEGAIAAALGWLATAQDNSATKDGGVARHFSLKTGWSSSYPETTGYIVPTLLHGGYDPFPEASARRADRMLDWLTSLQFPEGGFQGGMVDQTPRVPVTFNTGQILLGLSAGASRHPLYKAAMIKAADWLKTTQDDDGCWRKFPTPFAKKDDKTYETHVSLGLFAAHAIEPRRGYQEAGLKQVDWALRHQQENGWLAQCCLSDAERPLTHTIGYALRGIIGAYESAKRQSDLDAAVKLADALRVRQQPDGKLAGRFDSLWRPAVSWTCLTGLSQISECWFLLAAITGRAEFANAGKRANSYVRRTMVMKGSPDIKGGVKGSLPVSGDYGKWQYLNWACKFTIDANRAELAAEGRR
jgi:hypothetical protein